MAEWLADHRSLAQTGIVLSSQAAIRERAGLARMAAGEKTALTVQRRWHSALAAAPRSCAQSFPRSIATEEPNRLGETGSHHRAFLCFPSSRSRYFVFQYGRHYGGTPKVRGQPVRVVSDMTVLPVESIRKIVPIGITGSRIADHTD